MFEIEEVNVFYFQMKSINYIDGHLLIERILTFTKNELYYTF